MIESHNQVAKTRDLGEKLALSFWAYGDCSALPNS
jgi:hypothetical protein